MRMTEMKARLAAVNVWMAEMNMRMMAAIVIVVEIQMT